MHRLDRYTAHQIQNNVRDNTILYTRTLLLLQNDVQQLYAYTTYLPVARL